LIAKRWCRSHAESGADPFTKWTDDPDALGWADQLAAIARPPSGRLLTLVYAALAARLGVTEDEAKDLVFGDSLRRRRAARRAGGA
jgi:hypothetical protein